MRSHDSFNLLAADEVADLIGKSTETLTRWRRIGCGPAFVRMGRSPMYSREDIASWMQANRVLPGGAVASKGKTGEVSTTAPVY